MTMDSLFCATVYKATASTSLGLQLWAPPSLSCNSKTNGAIIVHIADHSLFAKKLKVGMQIHCINDVSCVGWSANQVKEYLDSLSGRVSVMTKSPRGCLASSSSSSSSSPSSPPSTTPNVPTRQHALVSDDEQVEDMSVASTTTTSSSSLAKGIDTSHSTSGSNYYVIPMVF